MHLRHNVMRWHPNTRGFGFQADIICLLVDQGFSFKEVPVKMIERRASGSSNALTFKNMLSVAHTLLDLTFRRMANWVYRRTERTLTVLRLRRRLRHCSVSILELVELATGQPPQSSGELVQGV